MNSVIGIGINVNQADFNHLPKATSLKVVTDKTYDIEEILADLMIYFEKEYTILEQKNFEQIHQTYLDNLFRKDEISRFRLDGVEVDGMIRDVNEAGNLVIEINQELREFKHKEIELLF